TMTPIYVGGLIRHFLERGTHEDEDKKTTRKENGILLSSGFIAGEGIAMVLVAIYTYIAKEQPPGIGLIWPGNLGAFVSLAAFGGLIAYLIFKSKK
ncbi:MAG: OPT/YSL family transporter, partial [Candidatus Aminicenantes bacterium]|nr:OPT/YSL family transporter [Candidatus Aminicenantes bacterium]